MANSEANALEIQTMFAALTDDVKIATQKRVAEILEFVDTAAAKNSANWAEREKYRAVIESRNSSLKYLLQRANDAIDATTEGGDPKNKKDKTSMTTKKC
jgi:hypothetical protein